MFLFISLQTVVLSYLATSISYQILVINATHHTFFLERCSPQAPFKESLKNWVRNRICCQLIHPLNSWSASLPVLFRNFVQFLFCLIRMKYKSKWFIVQFNNLLSSEKCIHKKSHARYTLGQWFSTGSDFVIPKGTFDKSWRHFWLSWGRGWGGGDDTDIWWVRQ